jgi:dihydrodipicolinate synthase/N-acetylneuraminate lyase
MHLDESSDDLLGTVLESSDLPIFLFHTPPFVQRDLENERMTHAASASNAPACLSAK